MAEADGPPDLEIAGQTVVIAYDREADVWYVHGQHGSGPRCRGLHALELEGALQVAVCAMSMP
jgi:hypothetical protein